MKRLFALLLPVLLAACDSGSVRDTLGISRKAPDEFRVLSRPPLSVPPDFNLRPPAAPGEVAGAEIPAREQAQELVFGSDSGALKPGTADTAVMPVTSDSLTTAGDSQFLRNAGAGSASGDIRTVLRQENASADPEDKTFLQKLREPSNNQPMVNAEAEAERLRQNREEGKPVTEGETPTVKPEDTGTLGKILGY